MKVTFCNAHFQYNQNEFNQYNNFNTISGFLPCVSGFMVRVNLKATSKNSATLTKSFSTNAFRSQVKAKEGRADTVISAST